MTAPGSLHRGFALAFLGIFTLGAGLIVWTCHEEPLVETVVAPSRVPEVQPMTYEVLALAEPKLHQFDADIENGTKVYKIKVVEDGDELIVDAETGRLLGTRPGRPATPSPSGKMLAPHDPMM